MKLYCSLTSPFARKVRVALHELGLANATEIVVVDPWKSPAELLADNPLSKVPMLRTAEGLSLPDSTLILDYLYSSKHAAAGPERWILARQAQLADGVIDAAVACVIEKRRPAALISEDWLARQRAAIARALDALEAESALLQADEQPDAFLITLACALAYLDFRAVAPDWRPERPRLTQWYAGFAQRPSMIETQPPQ